MKPSHYLLLLFTVILIILSSITLPVSAQQKNKNNYADMAAEILTIVNEHRTHMKLSALKMNEIIVNIATVHSKNMGTGVVSFGHDGFDERVDLLRKKVKPTNAWAENVAYGAKTAKQVVNMWLNSPEHRENIEGNYNQTGIGIFKGRDGYLYFTQIFCKVTNTKK